MLYEGFDTNVSVPSIPGCPSNTINPVATSCQVLVTDYAVGKRMKVGVHHSHVGEG